jgi:hypothetical protein
MTHPQPIRILLASSIAAFSLTPSALAGWQDPVGSPAAANTHFTLAAHHKVAAHKTSARLARAAAIARIAAVTKRLDANYRFDRVPAGER